MARKNKSKKDRESQRDSNDGEKDIDESGRFDSSKPQFRAPRGDNSKVVLDERFSSVLTDSRFQLGTKDKYGRKKKQKNQTKDELSAFYTIEDGEGEDKDDPAVKNTEKDQTDSESDDSSSSDESAAEKDDQDEEDEDPRSRIDYLTALSRGEVDMSSSSEDDDGDSQSSSDDESSDGEDPVHGRAGVLDPSARVEEEYELADEESPFIAVMNMDWAHVRAVDIFSIVASFSPPGAVKKVQVFPSDFGMEQMNNDATLGPTGLWKKQTSKPQAEDDLDEDDDESVESSSKAGSEDGASDSEDGASMPGAGSQNKNSNVESDFDPEKLRAYEASKLKYYFAVVELASPNHADIAYKEVDGLEFEHSGAAMDVRSIPPSSLGGVVKGRELRDEAMGIPSNYVPPQFVVTALQQTNVQCTWETGDDERQRALTKYASGEAWDGLTEADDLKAYMASDGSSDEEDVEEGDETEKGSNLRKMLGLDSDGSDDDANGAANRANSTDDESSSPDDSDGDGEEFSKEVKFVPGKTALQDKIRSKLDSKDEADKELTPWEKYQEKRKEKRRLKRHETRTKRKEVNDIRKGVKDPERPGHKTPKDNFFMDDDDDDENSSDDNRESEKGTARKAKSKEELELLVAGEDGDEEARDYDMRGLQRIAKNKDKKLRGSRKRKEEAVTAAVSGTDFKINVDDARFAAVLQGSDDRFGIDRTDANYKETTAMKEILAEQTRQRKAKRRKKSKGEAVAPNVSAETVSADSTQPASGASALSSLVKSLKSKVAKTTLQ